MPDPELLGEIERTLADSPFISEGHRKVWARVRRRGVHSSRKRVLRLTREAGLLAPTARVRRRQRRLQEGTITVDRPDTLWATDATEVWTDRDRRCAIFCVVDHATGEAWADASPRMDRLAAADLLREACHYQAELAHLGIARSPAYDYEPETNGVVEKFIQTLREQVPWIERFETLEDLRTAVRAFARTYNREWLIERLGYRSPVEARKELLAHMA